MRIQLPLELVSAAIDRDWYHSIELAPGRFTEGKDFSNFALTRHLLRKCSITGQHCLDIGTMEGVTPVLLCRRGAEAVTAVDGLNLSSKISIVQAAYGVEFEYFGNVSSMNIVDFLTTRTKLNPKIEAPTTSPTTFGFDLVVLSGVLYHVYSPLHVLGAARSCLRDGGLLVIETAAVRSESFYMQYNYNGSNYAYGWTDVWFPSLPLLDYLCRYLQLAPLDCVYLEGADPNFPNIIRVGIVCRAITGRPHTPQEHLMEKSAFNMEYFTLVNPSVDRQPGQADVEYDASGRSIVFRTATETCDVLQTILSADPLEYSRESLTLRLDDVD